MQLYNVKAYTQYNYNIAYNCTTTIQLYNIIVKPQNKYIK